MISLVLNGALFIALAVVFIRWVVRRQNNYDVTHVEMPSRPSSQTSRAASSAPSTESPGYSSSNPHQQYPHQSGSEGYSPYYDQQGPASSAYSAPSSPQYEDQSYFDGVLETPNTHSGMAAGAYYDQESAPGEVYTVEDYSYDSDFELEGGSTDENQGGVDGQVYWGEEAAAPMVVKGVGKGAPAVSKRVKPIKKIISETSRCNICLGFIKVGLPVVTCVCSKNYHLSCATRVGECPTCQSDLKDYEEIEAESLLKTGKTVHKVKTTFSVKKPGGSEAMETPPRDAKQVLQSIFEKYGQGNGSDVQALTETSEEESLFDDERLTNLKNLIDKYEREKTG